ncbi:MAG: hypothetical protein ACRC0V_08135 [Fusobacteriaceae bacterium]
METLEQKTEKKLQQKEVLRPKFLYLCMFITSYTMLNVYYGEYFTGIFLKIYLIITMGYITTTCIYIYCSRKRYPDDFLFLLYIFVSAVNILINGLRMNMSLLYIVVIISIFCLFFMMLSIILLRKKFFFKKCFGTTINSDFIGYMGIKYGDAPS